MRILIPSEMTGSVRSTFLADVMRPDGSLADTSFEFDFQRLRFIKPAGVVTLANAVEYARARGCRVTFCNHNLQADAISYLDDSGFFALYNAASLRSDARRRVTTAPFHRVSHADSHHWLETRFGHWLAGRLDLAPAAVASVQTCMKEIFNNINDHSTLQIGCTYMQHFPNKNEVLIAISDFGVGIPETMRRKFPELDDATAIHRASQPGVTSGTTKGNRGVGLDLLINLVVNTNRGSVQMLSGHGALACRMTGERHIREPSKVQAFYPGTMLSIRLDTTTFKPDDIEEEELQW